MSDMLSGGDMLIRALQEEGVDCMFIIQVVPYSYLRCYFQTAKNTACFN